MNTRAVVESKLAADSLNGRLGNLRFALWCCRALWLKEGIYAIASHLINTWYMDDKNPAERAAGIGNPWTWQPGVMHFFFYDLGSSKGMTAAWERCERHEIPERTMKLADYHPESFEAYCAGKWPPHTEGFEVKS